MLAPEADLNQEQQKVCRLTRSRLVSIIGNISLAKDIKSALQEAEEGKE